MNRETVREPSILRSMASLSIPAAIIAANLFLPLSLIMRQALIGVILIWFYVELLAGFPSLRAGLLEISRMKSFRFTPKLYVHSAYAVLAVALTTVFFLLIGRSVLGEAVIGLLYLVPVVWSAVRWGQAPSLAAALAAAMLFDFYFIPPFYTFTVGNLEGWLVLAIFLIVAGVVVNRIQSILSRAQTSEHEAMLMYELSSILAQARTREAVASGVARFIQRRYLANLVTVSIQLKDEAVETAAYEPKDGILTGKPDRVLALLDAWGLAGEIQIWQGDVELPAEDSQLFQSFAAQVGHVLERLRASDPDMLVETVLNDLGAENPAPAKPGRPRKVKQSLERINPQ